MSLLLIVTTVSFDQSTYTVHENDEYVQLVLVLSDVSSVDVIVQVTNKDITASELHVYALYTILIRNQPYSHLVHIKY